MNARDTRWKMPGKPLGAVAAFLCVLLVPAFAPAADFYIDFGSFNPAPDSTFAAAAPAAGVWNQAGGNVTNLVDTSGAATAAQLAVTTDVFGGYFPTTKGGNLGRLLDDNFYSANFFAWSLFITGLPNANYRVYYYAPSHPDVDTGKFRVNGVFAANLAGNEFPNFVQGLDWQVLPSVAVTNGTLTTSWEGGAHDQYSGLSGLQLVAIPEPASLSLLIAGATIMSRRSNIRITRVSAC